MSNPFIRSGPSQHPRNQLERRQPSYQTPEITEQATNAFHGASGFEIQGGQFVSAAGNIVMQSPQIHNVDQAHTGNLASTFIPSVIPEECESVTYARLLWSKGHGYPLWSPKPSSNLPEEYTTQGVHIGDVGIITANGGFDFLFNICKPAGHPINCNGVPPGFMPLGEPKPSAVAFDIEFSARSYLMSKSMFGGPSSSSRSTSSNNEQEELSYSFVCHGAEGALLLLPEGAFRQDLQNLGSFRQYAAQNGGLWYKYANGEQLGREASNGSIHLVTGFDKGNSWAVAAFSNAPLTHVHPRIDLELNGQEVHTHAGRSYYWDQLGPARIKYGPVPIDSANQCIFLRSFSISLSMRLWGKIFGVIEVTKTTDAPFERFLPNNPYIPFQGGSSPFLWGALSGPSSPHSNHQTYSQQPDTYQNTPEVMMSSTFVTGESHHPGRVINDFLLNSRPDAEVAISHDDQWAPLVRRVDNIDKDQVSQYISTHFDVKMEDGAVFLVDSTTKVISLPSPTQMKTLVLTSPSSTKPPFGPELNSVEFTGTRGGLYERIPLPKERFPDKELDKTVDNLSEFPMGSCSVSNFEDALTRAYCQSPYARERRPKNLVKSITRYREKQQFRHEYLVVEIDNHNGGSTSLKLESAQNQNAAIDVIEVFDDHRKHKEADSRKVVFSNNDFTLHDLSMIARVVHELRMIYPQQAVQSFWFIATVAKVAVSLYGPISAGQSPINIFGFGDQLRGANIQASADTALPLFEKLKDTNEKLIRDAAHSAETAKRSLTKAEKIEEDTREIARLQHLLAQNTIQGNPLNLSSPEFDSA